LGPRRRLAGGGEASAPALAAAQPFDESRDRRTRRDRQARLAGQQPDVPATEALDGHTWFGTHAKNPYKHNTAMRANPADIIIAPLRLRSASLTRKKRGSLSSSARPNAFDRCCSHTPLLRLSAWPGLAFVAIQKRYPVLAAFLAAGAWLLAALNYLIWRWS
jgi:hypothetical protein